MFRTRLPPARPGFFYMEQPRDVALRAGNIYVADEDGGLVILTFTAGSAGPWYVAPNGDDGNECLDPITPCATISGAIGKASAEDTVYVASGTYTGIGDEVVLIDKDITLSGGWDNIFASESGTLTTDGEDERRGFL